MKTKTTTCEATNAEPASGGTAVIGAFRSMAYSRSSVRLESANYHGAPDAWRDDRNGIRRDTARLDRAFKRIASVEAREPEAVAKALIEAAQGSRVRFLGAEGWEYITGQYTPAEIRGACARVVERAAEILSR